MVKKTNPLRPYFSNLEDASLVAVALPTLEITDWYVVASPADFSGNCWDC